MVDNTYFIMSLFMVGFVIWCLLPHRIEREAEEEMAMWRWERERKKEREAAKNGESE